MAWWHKGRRCLRCLRVGSDGEVATLELSLPERAADVLRELLTRRNEQHWVGWLLLQSGLCPKAPTMLHLHWALVQQPQKPNPSVLGVPQIEMWHQSALTWLTGKPSDIRMLTVGRFKYKCQAT